MFLAAARPRDPGVSRFRAPGVLAAPCDEDPLGNATGPWGYAQLGAVVGKNMKLLVQKYDR